MYCMWSVLSGRKRQPPHRIVACHCSPTISSTTPQLVAEEATNTRKPPGLLTVPVDNETGPPKDTKNSASANIFAPLLVDTFTPFLTSSVDAAVFEVCQEVVQEEKKKKQVSHHCTTLKQPPPPLNNTLLTTVDASAAPALF